jgi:RNA polymerase sigma-70 factor (ECF subfamily)
MNALPKVVLSRTLERAEWNNTRIVKDYRGGLARCQVHPHRGGWVLLFWYEHDDGDKVRSVATIDVEGDRVARLRNYFFTPDVIAEICVELGVPYRVNGYRYW